MIGLTKMAHFFVALQKIILIVYEYASYYFYRAPRTAYIFVSHIC